MKRISFLLALAALTVFSFGPAQGATEIVLDNMTGLYSGDTVIAGQSVKFTFRLTYTPGDGSAIAGFTNGFRVWTQSGGAYTNNFSPIAYDTIPLGWPSMFDGGFVINPFGVDGMGADTVSFYGLKILGPGIVDGFDTTVWWVETTPSTEGDTLCIDSSFFPPAGDWLWATNGPLGSFPPTWDGPHCFVIAQDPDSVGEVYLYDNIIENSSGRVSIGLRNEFPLDLFAIPLEFTDSSTFPVLDSVVWIGRLASPEILQQRIINLSADGNPPDTLLLVAINISATGFLAPGDGEVALLFFTSDSTGIAFCDTTFYPPVTSLSFVDSNSILYTPGFRETALVCLDVEDRPSEATILFPQDGTAFCGDSAGIWGGYFPSRGDTLPDGNFRQPDSASFWYSYDNMNYYQIGTDYSGSEPIASSYPSPDQLGDGWSVTMNANTLTEGWGWLRMLMYVDYTTVLGDTVPVYFFPDPPEVTVLSPDFEEGLGPTMAVFDIAVTPARHNLKIVVQAAAAHDYVKGVPLIDQMAVCPTWGKFYCGPTSVGACLLYWAFQSAQYSAIFKDTDGRTMSPNQIVQELADRMNTRADSGTKKSKLIHGTLTYLQDRGLMQAFRTQEYGLVGKPPPRFADLKKELERNKEDVVSRVKFKYPWDPPGSPWRFHDVVFNSLSNRANADGTHNVDIMQPTGGLIVNGTWEDGAGANNDSNVRYWGMENFVRNLFVISPKNPAKGDREDSTILFQQYTDDTLFTIEVDISDQAYDSVYFFTFRVVDTVSGIELEFEDYITYYRTTCAGMRGNINGLGGDTPNIADLTYLVAYLFKGGPAPVSTEEADVNGSGSINVSDLTYLVSYLFKGGPPPLPCP